MTVLNQSLRTSAVHAAHFADAAGELATQDASVLACNHCHGIPQYSEEN